MTDDKRFVEALTLLISRTDKSADAEAAAEALCLGQSRLSRVFELSAEDIRSRTGLNKTAASAIDFIDELCRYVGVEALGERPKLNDVQSAGAYFTALCRGRHVEYCYLACLDNSKRLINCRLLSKGTLDAAEVYIRDIAQTALRMGAKNALLAHNHPGGSLTPSRADIELTRKAIKALKMVDCELNEHIIVSGNACVGIIGGGYI